MSGNFLSCSKGVKDPLEVPEVRYDCPRDASAEMTLIPPGRENLLDFLELRQVLSTYDGDLRDQLCWPQGRPVPMRVVRGPLGIPLPSMPGSKTLCAVGGGTRGFLSSADMELGGLLESLQLRKSSSRVGACTCAFLPSCSSLSRFPFRGSRDLWLSLEVSHECFPRGFPTRLSHVPPWCESILGLKVKTVQGKQVSLEWTETSGGLWEWWHDPGVPLAFPVESASS